MSRGRSPHSPRLPVPDTTALPGRAQRTGDLDHAAILRALPTLRGADIALVSLVGSRGYGLAHADSDFDYRGLYVAPTTELLGIGAPKEQLEAKDPDTCVFELGKFARLAAAGNPNVLEILYADALIQSQAGRELVANRDAFLSQKVRATYGGYVFQQMRLATKGGRDSLYLRRRAKAIRHLFRLWEQGRQLLETGTLTVAVADPEALRAKAAYTDAQLERELERMTREIKTIESPLPESPDVERINALLQTIRLRALPAA